MGSIGFGFLGLLIPLLLLGLVVASIWAIVTTIRIPPRAPREPSCEKCRYRVAGLTSFSCPECGSDLRQVGIITLAMEVRRRGSLPAAILGWVFLMFIAAAVVSSGLGVFFASRMRSTGGGTTTTTTPLTPTSGAYTSAELSSTWGWGPGRITSDVDATLTLSDGSQWKLDYQPIASTYVILDPAGAPAGSPAAFDAKATDALYSAAGLDPADPAISSESRELSTLMGILVASPYTQAGTLKMTAFTSGAPTVSTASSMGTSPGTPEYLAGVVMLGGAFAWLLLLVGGIVFIVLRRKRLLRIINQPPAHLPA
jgi:hypothetical protein